jgi:hypothetical protein
VTEPEGSNTIVEGQVGYDPLGSDPTANGSWTWFPTTFNLQYDNNDEYQGNFQVPLVSTTTQFAYTYRFTLDGIGCTYCDTDGAGTNPAYPVKTLSKVFYSKNRHTCPVHSNW